MSRDPERVGNYQIVRKLGEGGMGVVYEAMHAQIKKRAAIKLLHAQYSQNPEFAQRFMNEAKAVSIVEHPGLVDVYEYGQLEDRTAFIVMEYLVGDTLKDRLAKAPDGKLPIADAVRLIRQIAQTLEATHARGIIHRDLKPENVMVVAPAQEGAEERTKVLDFGIAKLASEEDAQSHHTETGAMMGTPTYMSPEQCLGAGKVDDRTDVYSLGAMLFQVLAGRPPFVGDGKGALLLMHMTQAAPPLKQFAPEVPASLADLVARMLAKKREQRPSMTEVASALQLFAAGQLKARRRPAPLLAALGVVVVAGGAFVGWRALHVGRPQRTAPVPATAPPAVAPVATAPAAAPPTAASPSAPAEEPPVAATPAHKPSHGKRRATSAPPAHEAEQPARGGIKTRVPDEFK